MRIEKLRLLLVVTELLYVDSVLHLESLKYRRLVVLLTSAEFLHNACLLKLSLELLESSFDVLTILNWYDNHFVFFCLIWLLIMLLRGIIPQMWMQNY